MRHAPIPLLVFGALLCTLAFATDQPVVLLALALGALALHAAAAHRRRMYVIIGAAIGLGVTVLNPFVQANGDLILVELPDIPIFDLQVTLEEVVAGAALGLRAFTVTVAIGAILAHIDPDRLLGVVGRLLPRSALTASIAARMLPTLEHDAKALSETARLRGVSVQSGRWRTRATTAGALAVPLVGSALERSLDVAEAMAARGYGAGPRTRMAEAAWTAVDRLVLGLSLPMGILATLELTDTLGRFDFFPTLDPVANRPALITAAVVLAVAGTAAAGLRR